MGTFTLTYFVRKAVWERKNYWLASVAVYYLGTCWDQAGYHKTQMMKGQSKLFAERLQSIPKNADPWKY